MSQLLARIAKLSSKNRLSFSGFRSLSTAATPYMLFERTDKEVTRASGEEAVVELNLYDPRKEETVKFPEQSVTKELLTSRTMKSSRGWVFAENKYDSTLRLTNMFNPSASVSSRKVISLPPTKYLITNISLSASPDQEDCVVAALTCCSSLVMCRPGDSEWTPVMVPFYTSGMIYSERDGKFYLNKELRGKYNGPIDLVDTSSSGFPQMSLYTPALIDPYSDSPYTEIPESRLEQLSTPTTVQYIVESPSHEIFIVYWVDENLAWVMDELSDMLDKEKSNREELKASHAKEAPYQSSIMIKPRGFVVFRQDPEQKITSYTEDIGHLCIFLGFNESFCVSATEYPGLKPNSIYFAKPSTGFGSYDLSSNTVHEFTYPLSHSCCYNWLAPLQ